MNIMITGACGFLGRNLTKHFEAQGHDLILIDLPTDLDNDLRKSKHEVHFIDVTDDISLLSKFMEGVDIVIHAANKARIEPSWQNYHEYYRVNIAGSQQVFELAQHNRVKKFIYVSSSSVYGNNGCAKQKETDPLCPTNPYAVSKMGAESALKVQSLKSNTELVIVRPFTMYGDHMDYGPTGLVISKFIKAWTDNTPLLLQSGGFQSRDFIHASDVVRAFDIIIENSKNGSVYNLGSGKTVRIKDLADVVSNHQVITPSRLGEVAITHADIVQLKMLGFVARVNVLDWLADEIQKLQSIKIQKETVCH
jgi:nucleoside-diphosphate-sugar epimerase